MLPRITGSRATSRAPPLAPVQYGEFADFQELQSSTRRTRTFFLYRAETCHRFLLAVLRGDPALAIYHLVEDEVFETYMRDLFRAAPRCVAVYSTDADVTHIGQAPHVRHRCFSASIARQIPGWRMVEWIENNLSVDALDGAELLPDFHFFARV